MCYCFLFFFLSFHVLLCCQHLAQLCSQLNSFEVKWSTLRPGMHEDYTGSSGSPLQRSESEAIGLAEQIDAVDGSSACVRAIRREMAVRVNEMLDFNEKLMSGAHSTWNQVTVSCWSEWRLACNYT